MQCSEPFGRAAPGFSNIGKPAADAATSLAGSWSSVTVLSPVSFAAWGFSSFWSWPQKNRQPFNSLSVNSALHPSQRGRKIEYQHRLGWGRECQLCRVAGNTVWSYVARESPYRCANFVNCYTLVTYLLFSRTTLIIWYKQGNTIPYFKDEWDDVVFGWHSHRADHFLCRRV